MNGNLPRQPQRSGKPMRSVLLAPPHGGARARAASMYVSRERVRVSRRLSHPRSKPVSGVCTPKPGRSLRGFVRETGFWRNFCGAPLSALVLASDQRTDLLDPSVQCPGEPIVELSPRELSQKPRNGQPF